MTFGSMLLMAAFILVFSGCKKDTSTTLTKAEMPHMWMLNSMAMTREHGNLILTKVKLKLQLQAYWTSGILFQ
jgi:hypothetical protein